MKLTSRMRHLLRLGVRQKALLILTLVLALALSVSGWMSIRQEEASLRKEVQQRGTDIGRFVAKALSFSVVGYDYHAIQLLLDEIVESGDIDYAKVSNRRGGVMAEAGELHSNPASAIFNQPIALDGVELGTLTLGLSTTSLTQRLAAQKFSLFEREAWVILLIALGEFTALSFIIIRPLSRISRSLHDSVDQQGNLVGTIPVVSNDEFGELAEQFNRLSSQLLQANAQLKSRMLLADQQLIETNRRLLQQSEELRAMSDDFKRMSITDPLTGLNNRRRFEELMENEMELSRRYGDVVSLLVIDVDHFKSINDNYGHPSGDSVLKTIAHKLRTLLRTTDYLCRIGGEEFVAICRRADKATALIIAEELRRSIEGTSISVGDTTISLTISIGVATADKSTSEAARRDFYKHADIAMYQSKGSGRNKVTHFEDIPQESLPGPSEQSGGGSPLM